MSSSDLDTLFFVVWHLVSLQFLWSCEKWRQELRVWHFPCTLVPCVTVPSLHLRTLPQGPWVSSKTVLSHFSWHRAAPIAHCALNPHEADSAVQQQEQDELEGEHDFWCISGRIHLPSSRSGMTKTTHATGKLISYPTQENGRGQADTHNIGRIAGNSNSWLKECWRRPDTIRGMDGFHQVHHKEHSSTWTIDVVWGDVLQATHAPTAILIPTSTPVSPVSLLFPSGCLLQLHLAAEHRKRRASTTTHRKGWKDLSYRSRRNGIQRNHEIWAKELGIAHGLCNAVQIAKDLREFILEGSQGPTKEKIGDEHMQGEIIGKDHHSMKKKTTYGMYKRGSWVYHTAHSRDPEKIMKITPLRRVQFLESLQSCAQTYSDAPSNEESGSEGRTWQRVGQAEELASMARRYRAGRKKRQNSSFCKNQDLCHLKKLIIGQKVPKHTMDLLYYVEMPWKMTPARVQCSPSKELPRHTGQPPKFWMWSPDNQHAQDKQVMDYQLSHGWKWKMPQSHWDDRNQSASHLDSSITIPPPNSWDNIEYPVVPLARKFHGHPLAGLLWGPYFWKWSWCKVVAEKSKLGVFVHAPWKGLVVSPSMWTK